MLQVEHAHEVRNGYRASMTHTRALWDTAWRLHVGEVCRQSLWICVCCLFQVNLITLSG